MHKVQVLLSTYNGEKYLKELITSLLNQDYPNLNILIRDDGSMDNTVNILNGFRNTENVTLILGKNLGVVDSFFELIKQSDSEATFLAFCDQDDVWLSDKVSRAVDTLSLKDIKVPLMYCSNLTIVDENLQVLKETLLTRIVPAFENSLVQNIATGCTILINNVARNLILIELPQKAIMHDWWIYQIISAVGEVVFDNQSKILYRQHSSNVVGAEATLYGKWRTRLARFLKNKDRSLLRNQAKELDRIIGNIINTDKRKTLKSFIDRPTRLYSRISYAYSTELFRQDTIDDLIFKILIVLKMI